jgi:hypothetical protein
MFNRPTISRRIDAHELRNRAGEIASLRTHPDHYNNGDEERYRRPDGKLSYIGNFSKGLRHNYAGEVIKDAYQAMVRAMYSADPAIFERTAMMGTLNGLNLINPQAGLAFDLEGADGQAVTMPPAPRMDSAETAGEMAELYWMSVLRDVNFIDYAGAPALVVSAVNSLNNEFSDFRGPKVAGVVVPGTLFRGFTPGDLQGPYISQFLLKPISYGTLTIEQLNRVALAGQNYLTVFADWLAVQRGRDDRVQNMIPPGQAGSLFEPKPVYIRTLRDLATYVHFDALYEAYLNACLILLNMPARVDPGNPYIDMPMNRKQRTQDGFATFGAPHILTLVTEVATRALKAVWFQKWGVHRRLRPEAFGGRIEIQLNGRPASGPMNPVIPPNTRYTGLIHPEILNSLTGGSLSAHFPVNNTYLLPQAFIEGAPTHPAYGAGHATVAGACVTILKAWFDESEVFDPSVVPTSGLPAPVIAQLQENRRPKVPNAGGTALVNAPVGALPLTVGGELNKLAANISIGRNAGGVHWRSDYTESVRLGEEIAIRLLQEQKLTYNEDHHFSLTKFDGDTIII